MPMPAVTDRRQLRRVARFGALFGRLAGAVAVAVGVVGAAPSNADLAGRYPAGQKRAGALQL